MSSTAPRLVLVGGHESGDSADLVRYERLLPRAVTVRAGRRLHDVVSSAAIAGETVMVVPMTYGRDPAMVADAAKTLRWIAAKHRGSVALTAPFGVADHLTARLRAVAGAVRARDPGAALVVAARTSNPFDDAELHRVAHLVRVHGAGAEVMVATLDVDDAVATVLDRLRLLGFERSVVAPAGFSRGLDLDAGDPAFCGMSQHGPLMSDSAVARIVTERVDAARHDLHHGRDGIEAGLGADHGHGYAHSHDHEHGRGRMSNRKPTYEHRSDDIEINAGRPTVTLRVSNTGDRPVQIGSHFHFFEVNRALRFEREQGWGMHLDIPAGTGVRFEPGETKEVTLTAYAGGRHLVGFNGLVDGGLDARQTKIDALALLAARGFEDGAPSGRVARGAAKKAATKATAAKAPATKAKGTR